MTYYSYSLHITKNRPFFDGILEGKIIELFKNRTLNTEQCDLLFLYLNRIYKYYKNNNIDLVEESIDKFLFQIKNNHNISVHDIEFFTNHINELFF